jgi:ferredoxin-NADP reductase/Na+-translocating ferredoxin:NAD+ oxidoreductase RnfD subunit
MKYIDKILNNITMYRLLVYSLAAYAGFGILLAFMGKLAFSPSQLVASLFFILAAAYVTDRGLGKFLSVSTNMESALITSLILFLILRPADSVATVLALVLAGAISSASKFLVAWHGKHIFNPAAFAAAVVSLTGLQATTWWIGSSIFWPLTLILGLAIVRKNRRFPLVISFGIVSITLQYLQFVQTHQPILSSMKHALIASPFIFLATIMLTEPATMPPQRNQQVLFAGLIAALYVTGWSVGPIVVYPEVALLLGNLYAYLISPKARVRLRLKEIQKISDRVYTYVFQPDHRLAFQPGQYMEWTLADVPYDSRGNRRTFTIASSPTEEEEHLGIKYYEPASTFKAAFMGMKPGDMVYGSQLAGNFTLQGHEHKKLAFIAGGIGITPFRSMLKYLTDKNIQSNAVLIYVVSDPHEFAYIQQLEEASAVGVKVIRVVTDLAYQAQGVVTTKITADSLARLLPDYAERTFYISGPNAMVDGTKGYLRELGVARRHIKTDHFSGY